MKFPYIKFCERYEEEPWVCQGKRGLHRNETQPKFADGSGWLRGVAGGADSMINGFMLIVKHLNQTLEFGLSLALI